MNYGTTLPVTGAATITIGGIVFNQVGIAAIALGTIMAGVLMVRFGFRRNKSAWER